jgi:hypothetical protein
MLFPQTSAFAQDPAMSEVFVGYSLLNSDLDGSVGRDTANGWGAAYQYNINKNVGVVADIGNQYKSFSGARLNLFEYTFGPRYSYRTEKATVFGHALFGGTRAGGAAVTPSENFFTMIYGGGLDIAAGKNMSIRAVQADWMVLRDTSSTPWVWETDTLRLSFGVVFKFGQ